MSLTRIVQWSVIALVLAALVGLNYDFDSEAGMRVNAPLEDPLSQGLLGYWKMDEGTGTSTTADSSGNATTLTMTVMESGDWTTGQIGLYSLDFDGTAEYLTVADPAILDFVDGASFSFTGWFNRSRTFTTDDTIIAKKTDQSTNAGYTVWIDNNGTTDTLCINAYGTAGYTRCSTGEINAAGWHHFAISWNDAVGVNIFIDGALSNGTDPGGFSSVASLENTNAFRIGAESGTADNFFDGNIDDVRVYGFPLSADEVSKLYQTTAPAQPVDTGLVGHWTFDGPDVKGTTVIDRSGKGNDGTITGAVPALGKLGQGLSFNGTSDSVEISNESNFDFERTNPFSISAWVYQNQTATNNTIFCKKQVTGNTPGYDLRIDSLNQKLQTNINGTSGDSVNAATTNGSFAQQEWNFVVMTYDGSSVGSGLHLFINAIDETDSTDGPIASSALNDSSPEIGKSAAGGGLYFDGKLDDVRIYNRTLTQIEITNLYNLER